MDLNINNNGRFNPIYAGFLGSFSWEREGKIVSPILILKNKSVFNKSHL